MAVLEWWWFFEQCLAAQQASEQRGMEDVGSKLREFAVFVLATVADVLLLLFYVEPSFNLPFGKCCLLWR